MNYGPLAQAIEQAIELATQKPPRKKEEKTEIYNANLRRCWREIERCQDQFYDDVKSGRIIKGE